VSPSAHSIFNFIGKVALPTAVLEAQHRLAFRCLQGAQRSTFRLAGRQHPRISSASLRSRRINRAERVKFHALGDRARRSCRAPRRLIAPRITRHRQHQLIIPLSGFTTPPLSAKNWPGKHSRPAGYWPGVGRRRRRGASCRSLTVLICDMGARPSRPAKRDANGRRGMPVRPAKKAPDHGWMGGLRWGRRWSWEARGTSQLLRTKCAKNPGAAYSLSRRIGMRTGQPRPLCSKRVIAAQKK
jgi:hypothetical protein